MMGGVLTSGSRPGAMAAAVALGVLLVGAYEVARAALPLVPLGLSAVRAVAPRVLASAASNPGAVSVVGGGLRVTATQGASIAGMGAVITVQRTAQRDALAAAMLGLGSAALVGEALIDTALDAVDCDLGPGTAGYRCAAPSDQLTSAQVRHCLSMHNGTPACNPGPDSSYTFTTPLAAAQALFASAPASCGGTAVKDSFRLNQNIVGQPFAVAIVCRFSGGTYDWYTRSGFARTVSVTACPGGSEASRFEPSRCRPVDVASWPSASSEDLRVRLSSRDGWASVPLGGWLGGRGAEVPDAQAPTVVVSAPPTIDLGVYAREWELPDGSIVREVTEWKADQTWEDDVITSRTRSERRVEPPGAVIPSGPATREESRLPPPASGGGVTPSPAAPAEPAEDRECGLPGTPPCKLDETGTPTGEAILGPEAIDPVVDQVEGCIANPASCLPALPTLSWNFALPTNCSAIPTPAFSPALTEIDVCEFQPVIHDLMSVVWMLGGLFGAIGLFWRKTLAS